jgi:F-type H+-transporting ATPase subunit epsilon
MSAPASGPFWRAAGMSYLKYANICADMLRSVLKDSYKAKALPQQAIYFRSSKFVDGKQSTPGALGCCCCYCCWWWRCAYVCAVVCVLVEQ